MTLRIQSVLALIALNFSFCGIVPAFADNGAPSADASAAAVTTVRGKATFERRSTIVPMLMENPIGTSLENPDGDSRICVDGSCPKPQHYWSLIIASGGVRYELSQPVALGDTNEIDDVELQGVVIHSGDEVALQGEVQDFSPDYGVISRVSRVSISTDAVAVAAAPEAEPASDPALQPISDAWDTGESGWSCVGNDDQGVVEVDVWYGEYVENPTSASYHMRVSRQASPASPGHVLMQIDQLQVENQSTSLGYIGTSSSSTSAVLVIYRQGRKVFGVPAHFRLQKSDFWGNPSGPAYENIEMTCNPTRLPGPMI